MESLKPMAAKMRLEHVALSSLFSQFSSCITVQLKFGDTLFNSTVPPMISEYACLLLWTPVLQPPVLPHMMLSREFMCS